MAGRRARRVGVVAAVAAAVVVAIVATTCQGRPSRAPVAATASGSAQTAKGAASTRRGSATPRPGSRVHGALRLEGQVIDEAQKPVANAVVAIGHDLVTTSGEDGTFVFEQLAAGRYQVGAHLGELYAMAVRVRLSATSEPVILRMRRGATLVVTVEADGKPLAGAHVVRDPYQDVVTGADGIARLPGLRPEFHDIAIDAPGYASEHLSLRLNDDPGGIIERRVTLRRGATLSGTVIDPAGKLVANAYVDVAAAQTDPTEDGWAARVRSDETGTWRCDVAAGSYELQASSDDHGAATAVIVEADGKTPQTGIVLRVETDAQIVGAVSDARGQPIVGATVFVIAGDTEYDASTKAGGRFELLGIDANDYSVFAVGEGGASPTTRVTVADGERAEIKLVLTDSNITGVVVDRRGEPIALAEVEAMPKGDVTRASFGHDTTDSQGRFDLGGLPPGDYEVSARWPDQPDYRVGGGQSVATGTKDLRLVLDTPGTIKGRVLLAGKPVTHYGILLTETPEFWWIGDPLGVNAADGRFVLRDVEPGTWGAIVIGPGTQRYTIERIEVTPGKVIDLGDIELVRGSRISGRVLDGKGAAVAGASVIVGPITLDFESAVAGWFQGRYATTSDATGAYVFEGIADVTESVVALHPDHGRTLPSSIPKGDAVIDLSFSGTGGIDGVIEGIDRNADIVMARRIDDHGDTTTNRPVLDGRFSFNGLAPGTYELQVLAGPNKLSATTQVTVAVNKRAKVTLSTGDKRIALTVKAEGSGCKMISLGHAGAGSGADLRFSNTAFGRCTHDAATFEVAPGAYRACPDLENCQPVTAAAAPAAQTVHVRAR